VKNANAREQRAAILAVLALAIWIGGLVALGACAAPIVFKIVPAPFSGEAMGAVFRRFDKVAISCAIVVLGCEAVRIWVREGSATTAERLRGLLAVTAAGAAIYGGLELSPSIVALHAAGAVRGLGESGVKLDRIHDLAEAVAKVEVTVGFFLLALHVATLNRQKEQSP
jgi:uncharacterized membrane protein